MGTEREFSNRPGCRVGAMVDNEGPTMGGTKRKRAAWATGLSLALHVLMLAGMVLGLKVAKPPPEGRAIELTLVQPLERVPAPAQPAPPQARAAAPPPLRPHLAPAQPAVPPPGV